MVTDIQSCTPLNTGEMGWLVWLCELFKVGGGVPMVTAALLWFIISWTS